MISSCLISSPGWFRTEEIILITFSLLGQNSQHPQPEGEEVYFCSMVNWLQGRSSLGQGSSGEKAVRKQSRRGGAGKKDEPSQITPPATHHQTSALHSKPARVSLNAVIIQTHEGLGGTSDPHHNFYPWPQKTQVHLFMQNPLSPSLGITKVLTGLALLKVQIQTHLWASRQS